MIKRLIICKLAILATVFIGLPVAQAQTLTVSSPIEKRRGIPVRISSYEDDPFVHESLVRRLDRARFESDANGLLALSSDRVIVLDERFVYRQDRNTGEFKTFAWNPWPVTRANQRGDFRFPGEERFPLFKVERGPDGKIILDEGLQVWTPQDLNLGSTTSYEGAYAVIDAAEHWAGRHVGWGNVDQAHINAHSFIDFNAFYSPTARQLFFGVIPYRLPGETEVKIFETATSWELVAHESGHAVQHALKRNIDVSDPGYRTWSESFGDQMAMWASLRKLDRVSSLLAETHGDLNSSNSLTRLAEAFAVLVGEGNALRDAFHDKKISDTGDEVHDRSEVFTGAAYKLFLAIYSGLKCEEDMTEWEALKKAGEMMGTFLMRANDYTPENTVTLEDVAKAYLKVDKEFYNGRYHSMLVGEFVRREIFDASSEMEWMAHEASVPDLRLQQWPSDHEVEELVQANLDLLGVGPDFGLSLQEMVRDNHLGQIIVRVQLTLGRDGSGTPIDNHGILVFRQNGTLADYHAPLPPAPQGFLQTGDLSHAQAQTQAPALFGQAKQLSLDQRGAPLSVVRMPNGQLTVEARVIRGEGLNTYMEVFTLDKPQGERREIMLSPIPPAKQLRLSEELLK